MYLLLELLLLLFGNTREEDPDKEVLGVTFQSKFMHICKHHLLI